jgi:hypothetical protein
VKALGRIEADIRASLVLLGAERADPGRGRTLRLLGRARRAVTELMIECASVSGALGRAARRLEHGRRRGALADAKDAARRCGIEPDKRAGG